MFNTIFRQRRSHLAVVLVALFVTFLWSTSWVFIKIGLVDIPPLTFAGLRYSLAFAILLPVFLYSQGLKSLSGLPQSVWKQLFGLGILHYALTNGAQFVSLASMPAVTVNLMWGFTPILVALLGLRLLAERPSTWQWLGIGVSILGLLIYFYPIQSLDGQTIGIVAIIIGVLANSTSAILGRSINRSKHLSALTVTTVSMGIGAAILLITGILLQGLPTLSWQSWAIIGWLSVVNTAFAFTLWNYTLQRLSAMESSIINNAMGVQIPILAVLFLGERLTWRELLGLIIAIIGVLFVQFVLPMNEKE